MANLIIPILTEKQIKRFLSKINRRGDCWIWESHTYQNGYGCISLGKVKYGVHRVSWVIHNGQIPDGLEVCHNCPGGDNRACVNPKHLWLGTHQENMKDAYNKGVGNFVPGENHPDSKLTDYQVLLIREGKELLGKSNKSQAEEFGVSQSLISMIVNRKRRK